MVPTSSRSAIASAVTNQTVHQPLIVQPPRHRRRLIRHRRDCQGGKQRRRSTVSTQSSLATTLTNQKPVRMTINGDDINNGNDHIMTNSNKHATHMTDETTESTNTSARTTKATKIPISLRKSRREKKRALTEKEWSADSESQNPSQATVTGPAPSGTQSLSASDLANYLVDEGTRLFNDILKPSGWTWQYTSRTLSGYAIVAPGVKVTGAQEGITLFTSFMALGEQYNKDGKNSIDIVTRATKALVKSGAIPSKFKPEKADRMDMKLGNKSEPSQDSKSQSTKIKDRHESSKSLRNCNSSEINEKQSEMVREPATKKLRAIETSEYDPNRFCNSHERRQTSDIAKNDQHRPTQSLSFTSNQSNKLNKHRVAADDTNLNTKMPATTKHRSGPTREYLGSTGNDNQKVLQGTSDVATEDTIENSCSLTHGEVYIIPNTIHKIESSERRAQESVQRSTLERGFIHNASDEEVPGNRETKVVPIMEINPDKSLCSAEPLAVQCQDLGASHLICRLSDDEPKRITETIVVESITTQSEDTTNSAIPPQKLSQDSTAEAEEQAMLKDSDNFCMKNSSVEFVSSVSLPDLAKYTKNGHDPSQQDNARTGSRGLVEKEPRSQRRKKYPESWLSTVANREESRIRTTRDHLYRDKERNIVHRPQGYHTNNTVGFAVRKGVKRGGSTPPRQAVRFYEVSESAMIFNNEFYNVVSDLHPHFSHEDIQLFLRMVWADLSPVVRKIIGSTPPDHLRYVSTLLSSFMGELDEPERSDLMARLTSSWATESHEIGTTAFDGSSSWHAGFGSHSIPPYLDDEQSQGLAFARCSDFTRNEPAACVGQACLDLQDMEPEKLGDIDESPESDEQQGDYQQQTVESVEVKERTNK